MPTLAALTSEGAGLFGFLLSFGVEFCFFSFCNAAVLGTGPGLAVS
jgi:hypothetical protein